MMNSLTCGIYYNNVIIDEILYINKCESSRFQSVDCVLFLLIILKEAFRYSLCRRQRTRITYQGQRGNATGTPDHRSIDAANSIRRKSLDVERARHEQNGSTANIPGSTHLHDGRVRGGGCAAGLHTEKWIARIRTTPNSHYESNERRGSCFAHVKNKSNKHDFLVAVFFLNCSLGFKKSQYMYVNDATLFIVWPNDRWSCTSLRVWP